MNFSSQRKANMCKVSDQERLLQHCKYRVCGISPFRKFARTGEHLVFIAALTRGALAYKKSGVS